MANHIKVAEAVSSEQICAVVSLLRDFELWILRTRDDIPPDVREHVVSSEWLSELTNLAAHYGAPFGGIILSQVESIPAGCILLRGISHDTCEFRLTFVRPAFAMLDVDELQKLFGRNLAASLGYRFLKEPHTAKLQVSNRNRQPLTIASAARRAVMTLESRNVPSRARLPWLPPPPNPADSPTA